MNLIEAYSLLFSDSLMGSLLIIPHKEYVFKVMKTLNNYNLNLMIVFAAIGSTIGLCLNFFLGIALRCFEPQDSHSNTASSYDKIASFIRKYYNVLLLFSPITLVGPVITILCGLFKVPIHKILLLGTISNLIYFYINSL